MLTVTEKIGRVRFTENIKRLFLYALCRWKTKVGPYSLIAMFFDQLNYLRLWSFCISVSISCPAISIIWTIDNDLSYILFRLVPNICLRFPIYLKWNVSLKFAFTFSKILSSLPGKNRSATYDIIKTSCLMERKGAVSSFLKYNWLDASNKNWLHIFEESFSP